MNGKGAVVMLVLMFALAVGAGAVAAKLSSRGTAGQVIERGTLSDELHLTSTQNSKMQRIWEDVRDVSHDLMDQARKIQVDEDNALAAILTDEQKEKFAQLRQQSKSKLEALSSKRSTAFNDAVKQTEAILDDSQRKIYRQIIKDRVGMLPQ